MERKKNYGAFFKLKKHHAIRFLWIAALAALLIYSIINGQTLYNIVAILVVILFFLSAFISERERTVEFETSVFEKCLTAIVCGILSLAVLTFCKSFIIFIIVIYILYCFRYQSFYLIWIEHTYNGKTTSLSKDVFQKDLIDMNYKLTMWVIIYFLVMATVNIVSKEYKYEIKEQIEQLQITVDKSEIMIVDEVITEVVNGLSWYYFISENKRIVYAIMTLSKELKFTKKGNKIKFICNKDGRISEFDNLDIDYVQ